MGKFYVPSKYSQNIFISVCWDVCSDSQILLTLLIIFSRFMGILEISWKNQKVTCCTSCLNWHNTLAAFEISAGHVFLYYAERFVESIMIQDTFYWHIQEAKVIYVKAQRNVLPKCKTSTASVA